MQVNKRIVIILLLILLVGFLTVSFKSPTVVGSKDFTPIAENWRRSIALSINVKWERIGFTANKNRFIYYISKDDIPEDYDAAIAVHEYSKMFNKVIVTKHYMSEGKHSVFAHLAGGNGPDFYITSGIDGHGFAQVFVKVAW